MNKTYVNTTHLHPRARMCFHCSRRLTAFTTNDLDALTKREPNEDEG